DRPLGVGVLEDELVEHALDRLVAGHHEPMRIARRAAAWARRPGSPTRRLRQRRLWGVTVGATSSTTSVSQPAASRRRVRSASTIAWAKRRRTGAWRGTPRAAAARAASGSAGTSAP